MFVTSFSVDINTLPENFQIQCIKLQSDIQLKKTIMFLYQTLIRPLTRDKYPSLHNQALFMSSLFGRMYICEKLSRMKYRKSNISSNFIKIHI